MDTGVFNTSEDFVVRTYADMVYKVAVRYTANFADAEDVFSETFLTYFRKDLQFESEEHRKAWLIRVATNICKNTLRFKIRHSTLNIDEVRDVGVSDSDADLFEAIMELPPKYKLVMDLYYMEGYRIKEISDITGASPDAIRKRLQYARNALKIEFERCDSLEIQ